MKRTIKVGIIQQTCTNDIRHNLSKLHHNIEQVVLLPASTVSWLPDTVLYWLLRYSRSVLRGYITIQPSFLTKMAV